MSWDVPSNARAARCVGDVRGTSTGSAKRKRRHTIAREVGVGEAVRQLDAFWSSRNQSSTVRGQPTVPGGSNGKGVLGRTYRSIKNADAFQAYAKKAVPAVEAAGGRFIVRGMPTKVHEAGMNQRVVLIEFDDIAKATAAHYQAALKLLGDGADRDIRIVEGVA